MTHDYEFLYFTWRFLCYTGLMTNRIYIEAAHVYVETTPAPAPVKPEFCPDCGWDHFGACETPDPFEMDRPDLDFWDQDPSPYDGTYSEM